jgi:hypothetical protein
MSGWSAVHAFSPLPALYVLALALGLSAALRRWFDPVPHRVLLLFLLYIAVLLAPVLAGDAVSLPLDVLCLHPPYQALPLSDPPGIPLQRDLVHQIAPWELEVKRALLAGRWPLWNSRQGAGTPLMADPQAQAFQPLVALAYPFSIWTAAGVTAALKVLAALVGSFLLLRRQGLGEAAAAAGATAFGLGGFVMLWLGWPLATCAALMPVVLYAIARCDDVGGRRDFLLLTCATTALLLAGHPETLVYTLAFAALFLLDRCRRRRPRRAGLGLLARGALALLLAAALATPVLLPTLAFVPLTGRFRVVEYVLAPRPLPQLWHDLLQAPALAQWLQRTIHRWVPIVAPNAFGDQRVVYWGANNYIQDTGEFAGSLTLVFALPALAAVFLPRTRRFPQERLMALALLASLALLAQPPGFDRLAHQLPLVGMTATHKHQRIQVVLVFCLCYLAACQLERWRRGELRWRTVALALGAAAALVACGYIGNGNPASPGNPWDYRMHWMWIQAVALGLGAVTVAGASLAAISHTPSAAAPEMGLSPASPWIQAHLRPAGSVGVAAGSGADRPAGSVGVAAGSGADRRLATSAREKWRLGRAGGRPAEWAPWVVTAIIAGELLRFYVPANPPCERRLAFPQLPAVRFLEAHLGVDRLAGAAGALPANFAQVYGLSDARVDNPSEPFLYAVATHPVDTGKLEPRFGRFGHPLYDFLGVRYVVSRAGANLPFRLAFADSTASIWERPHPLSLLFLPERALVDRGGSFESWLDTNPDFGFRALVEPGPEIQHRWLARDPDASSLRMELRAPTRLRASASLAEPRLLATSIYQDGGWQVLAGARPVPPVRVNGTFAGAWLAAGKTTIDLLYRPPSLPWGCLLAALATAAGAAWWVPPPGRLLGRDLASRARGPLRAAAESGAAGSAAG